MAAYNPLLTPEEAKIATKTAAETGLQASTLEKARAAWLGAVTRKMTDALIDKMGEECIARGVADSSSRQTDPKFDTKSQEALDETLSPLAKWVGHDWIGQTLGVADATNDDAMQHLFATAGKMVAEAAWEKGVKGKGSEAKFLSSEGITVKQIEDMMENQNNTPVYSEQDKPFIEFKACVTQACVEMMGAEWWTQAAKASDDESLRTALQCGGYAGSDAEISSLRYALSVQPIQTTPEGIVETPAPSPASVVTTTLTQPSSDGAPTVAQAVGFARTVMKDPDIAALLGVSRGTVANIEKGTAKTPVTPEGAQNLLSKLVEIANAATAAADTLHAHATA